METGHPAAEAMSAESFAVEIVKVEDLGGAPAAEDVDDWFCAIKEEAVKAIAAAATARYIADLLGG